MPRWFALVLLLLAGCAGSGGAAGAAGVASGGAAGQPTDDARGGGGDATTLNAGAGNGPVSVGGSATGGLGGTAGSLGGGSGASGAAGLAGSSGTGGAPQSGLLKLMPLGDSITEGSFGTNAGYRGPLYALLTKTALQVSFVGSSVQGTVTTDTDPLPMEQQHNEGHPSYTINDIDNNLDGLDTTTFQQYGGADRDPNGGHWFDGIASGAEARPALYPDIITLMVGTNNLSDTDRTEVQTELHALLTKITTQRPSAYLIVAQITPNSSPNITSYNVAVAAEVTTFAGAGKRVTLIDMNTGFPSDGLSADGIHPNDTGYAFMAQKWFAAVTALML